MSANVLSFLMNFSRLEFLPGQKTVQFTAGAWFVMSSFGRFGRKAERAVLNMDQRGVFMAQKEGGLAKK